MLQVNWQHCGTGWPQTVPQDPSPFQQPIAFNSLSPTMPDSQDRNTIRETYRLDYYRRPWATRLWKSRWNWTALLISVFLVFAAYGWQRDRMFQAAPVSSVHGMFGENCAACHDQRWQAAVRLATLDDTHYSVSDNACRRCHSSADHTKRKSPAPACAACHQEHRPHKLLTAVRDAACVSCHSNIGDEVSGVSHFHATIQNFGSGAQGHPEFALLRSDNAKTRASTGLDLVAFQWPSDSVSGNSVSGNSVPGNIVPGNDSPGKWFDKGGLKFNHKVHLDPKGVLVEGGHRKQLDCFACHVPDNSGKYMQPIQYEQHCAECHPLRFSKPLDVLQTIPHAAPEKVRGVLRERLANRFVLEGQEGDNMGSTVPRLPLLPQPAALSDQEARRVDSALVRAEHALFGLEAKNGCRQCHLLEADGRSWRVRLTNLGAQSDELTEPGLPDRRAAMVPDRWLPHGQFHHEKHRAISCHSCHNAAESTQTTDILLPSIDVCRKCHGANLSSGSRQVSADCVLCHKYHGEGDRTLGIPLEELSTVLQESPQH